MKVVSSLAFLVSLLIAGPAFAQDGPGPISGVPLQRYVAVFGGVAASGSETTPVVSGEFGESVGRHAQAYMTFSYFDNVMTDAMRDNLLAAADAIVRVTGVPRTFSGRDQGIAFTAGGKFVTGNRVRPYVGGGAGAIHINRTISEASLGDVTASFAEQTGLGDGLVNAGETEATKPLVEGVAGVGFVTRSTYIDIGYRYRRAFHSPTTLDLSQFTVGIGAKW